VLIGDSIRMGYESLVRDELKGRTEVWATTENCGNSMRIRENLKAWAIDPKPDIVHFNAGIHDLGWLSGESVPRFTIAAYLRNLRLIVERLQKETRATLIFATTTPFLKPCDPALPKDQCVSATIVARYNRAAVRLMRQKGLRINDLYRVIEKAGVAACVCDDKIHMSDRGNRLLAGAVARCIRGEISTRRRLHGRHH
jgi:lysophospholipase L1-like esterase